MRKCANALFRSTLSMIGSSLLVELLTISRSSSSPQRDFCQTPIHMPLFLLPIYPLRIQNGGPGHTLGPNIKTSPRLLYFLCNPFLFPYRLTHAFEMASFCVNGHSRNRRVLLLPKLIELYFEIKNILQLDISVNYAQVMQITDCGY